MQTRRPFPGITYAVMASAAAVVCLLAASAYAGCQPASGAVANLTAGPVANPEPLDRVIAVVNNQVVLASDLDLEIRMSRLLPVGDDADANPARALDRLITRALIEQQILLEDPHGLEVDPREVDTNLDELRQNLPACGRRNCQTAAGWSAYLARLGLTTGRVEQYWVQRMAVLAFIERRFRSGIRIAPEEIEAYYTQKLAPLYPAPADAPPLAKISSRIQEVLLQERVNALLNDWLQSLQTQGEVEILDPVLAAQTAALQPATTGESAAATGAGPRREAPHE